MLLRHECLLYHDLLTVYRCDMLGHVKPTNLYRLLKLTFLDFLAKLSMALVSGFVSLLTIEQPRKQSVSKLNSTSSSCNIELGPRMKLYSNQPFSKDPDSYRINSKGTGRDLCMLYTWVNANDKATQKYVDYYLQLGYDILKFHTDVQDCLRPETGTQIYAEQVVNFLKQNDQYTKIVVHGMSIGGYSFGEAVVKIKENPTLYGNLPEKFVALIFDSGVDYRFTAKGLSKTLVKSKFMQKCIQSCFNAFLKINYNHSTRHYENSSIAIRLDFLKAPTLFICSKVDYLSSPEFLKMFAANMSNTKTVCFEKSPHIQHYRHYPEEYESEIKTFLQSISVK